METTKRFNLYIVRYSDSKAVSKWASNLPERKVGNAVMMGLSRCNSDYGCWNVEVDSEDDKKYANDLLSK